MPHDPVESPLDVIRKMLEYALQSKNNWIAETRSLTQDWCFPRELSFAGHMLTVLMPPLSARVILSSSSIRSA